MESDVTLDVNNANAILNNLMPLIFVIAVIVIVIGLIRSVLLREKWLNIFIQLMVSCVFLACLKDITIFTKIGQSIINLISSCITI